MFHRFKTHRRRKGILFGLFLVALAVAALVAAAGDADSWSGWDAGPWHHGHGHRHHGHGNHDHGNHGHGNHDHNGDFDHHFIPLPAPLPLGDEVSVAINAAINNTANVSINPVSASPCCQTFSPCGSCGSPCQSCSPWWEQHFPWPCSSCSSRVPDIEINQGGTINIGVDIDTSDDFRW